MSTENTEMKSTEIKVIEVKAEDKDKPETKETFAPDKLVGMEKDKASTAAKTAGYTTRIAEEDGEVFMGTMDYKEKRINLSITKGVISKVKLG